MLIRSKRASEARPGEITPESVYAQRRQILKTARGHGVGAGIHFWLSVEREIAWAEAGGNLIMHSSDLTAFSRTLEAEIKSLRQSLGR